MTPLGSATWRLIRDDSLTLGQRFAAAYSVWTSGSLMAAAYGAEFAGRCFLLAERTRQKLGEPLTLDMGQPSPELVDLVGEVVWDSGQRAWDILAAMHVSQSVGTPDPFLNDALRSIERDYGAVAFFMFVNWGRGALDFVRGADPDVEEAVAWLEAGLEELDGHLDAFWPA